MNETPQLGVGDLFSMGPITCKIIGITPFTFDTGNELHYTFEYRSYRSLLESHFGHMPVNFVDNFTGHDSSVK
jgi:hypothetical protein